MVKHGLKSINANIKKREFILHIIDGMSFLKTTESIAI
jgi:hypothetical protein